MYLLLLDLQGFQSLASNARYMEEKKTKLIETRLQYNPWPPFQSFLYAETLRWNPNMV